MRATDLGVRPAFVSIDLQRGIAAMQTVHPASDIVEKSAALARAFRQAKLPVVLVNVAFSPDGADALRSPVDEPVALRALPPDFSELMPEVAVEPSDLRITKRQWGAFYGTELDLQLRRRGVTGIVIAGIATSIGVESTARAAYELGYALVFAGDAMTDRNDVSHAHSLERIFPRIGCVRTTEEILGALAQR